MPCCSDPLKYRETESSNERKLANMSRSFTFMSGLATTSRIKSDTFGGVLADEEVDGAEGDEDDMVRRYIAARS
jgi:hypothetical protein